MQPKRQVCFGVMLSFLALLAIVHGSQDPTEDARSRGTDLGSRPEAGLRAMPQRPNVEIRTFPTEWTYKAGATAPSAEHGMVASNCAAATKAGVAILRAGGNAIDAAVAVGFALAVAYPEAGNLGGGGYAVLQLADGRSAALDFRETAPAAATPDMYIGANGKPTDQSLVGHRASGVPGSVAGLLALLDKYGTMSRGQVMAPAIRLARDGVEVDQIMHASIAENADLIKKFAGARLFLPGGQPPPLATRLVQNELAVTLERIAAVGRDGFYKGPVADAVGAELKRGGGLITGADLAGYAPVWREPLKASYRGYGLVAMPPSSSGGVTVVETLNILETYQDGPAWNSTLALHRLASAFQRAFVDRNNTLGDPAFVKMPLERMTSKPYAASLRSGISDARHTPTATLKALPEGTQTTNYCVVDRAGNAVGVTTTINSLYGSGVWIPGGGFFMNNEMDDFTVQPGTPNQFGLVQGKANAIAPGKRMLSAMAPTIVLDADGKVWMVVGGRGGPRIITAVVQAILNAIDYRMGLADAVGAPRIHDQALPDVLEYEKGGVPSAVVKALEAKGWQTKPGGTGSLTAIKRLVSDAGGRRGWEGVFDPRKHGLAEGY